MSNYFYVLIPEATVKAYPGKNEKEINGEISAALKHMPGKKGCKNDRVNI